MAIEHDAARLETQCHICPYCKDDHAACVACDELMRLARLGASVEAMPGNTGIAKAYDPDLDIGIKHIILEHKWNGGNLGWFAVYSAATPQEALDVAKEGK